MTSFAIPPIYCPGCLSRLHHDVTNCPSCGADVAATVAIQVLAAARFNDALEAAQSGDWHRAGGAIDAALAILPDDIEARVLAIKVFARLGSRADVDRHFQAAGQLQPSEAIDQIHQAALGHVRRLERQRARRRRVKQGGVT